MINSLEIQNFKSIESLNIDCKRLNIFIGEPNTGKSNILECLGLLSFTYFSSFGFEARQFVRFESTSNLFYDENIGDKIGIRWDSNQLTLSLKDGNIVGEIPDSQGVLMASLGGDFTDIRSGMRQQFLAAFKYYKFKSQKAFESRESSFLLPPNGNNLMSLLVSNKELRIAANQPFLSRGLRLGLRPQEFKIEVIKDVDDVIISSPYSLSSDTYQRLVFYLAAILTNKDSVLVFEEPEAHAFPFYTKYLAEMIALEENNNQYFISTHNPYFLMPRIEKAPIDDLAVFIAYYEDYQTKVKLLDRSELERLTEIDVFSNLPAFLEDD